MAKIYKNAAELVGNTPLLEVGNLEKELGLEARILVKLEYFNPAGSAKDRIALSMIEDAEERGVLKPGAVIIEPTSGNTGIGLASLAAIKGYRVILTMPETMSVERRNILKAYGAEIVLTDGTKGMNGAIAKANELAKEYENSFIPGQFDNPANPAIHKKTTGPEIWRDTDGQVDVFVAGVGTGGTITGVGEYLKSQNPDQNPLSFFQKSQKFLLTVIRLFSGSHNQYTILTERTAEIASTQKYSTGYLSRIVQQCRFIKATDSHCLSPFQLYFTVYKSDISFYHQASESSS